MLPVPTAVPLLAPGDWPLPIGPASHPSVRSDSWVVAVAFVAAASGQRSGPLTKPLKPGLKQTQSMPALNRTLDFESAGNVPDAIAPVAAQPSPAREAQVPTPTMTPTMHPC